MYEQEEKICIPEMVLEKSLEAILRHGGDVNADDVPEPHPDEGLDNSNYRFKIPGPAVLLNLLARGFKGVDGGTLAFIRATAAKVSLTVGVGWVAIPNWPLEAASFFDTEGYTGSVVTDIIIGVVCPVIGWTMLGLTVYHIFKESALAIADIPWREYNNARQIFYDEYYDQLPDYAKHIVDGIDAFVKPTMAVLEVVKDIIMELPDVLNDLKSRFRYAGTDLTDLISRIPVVGNDLALIFSRTRIPEMMDSLGWCILRGYHDIAEHLVYPLEQIELGIENVVESVKDGPLYKFVHGKLARTGRWMKNQFEDFLHEYADDIHASFDDAKDGLESFLVGDLDTALHEWRASLAGASDVVSRMWDDTFGPRTLADRLSPLNLDGLSKEEIADVLKGAARDPDIS
jgi:hypothetical protein